MKKTDENELLYVFIALRAFIKGFDHCRLVVVVDGSHLTGMYTGTFVIVCTIDEADIMESINGVLVSARKLPIYDFLEEVRLLFTKWNCENRQEASYTFTILIEKFNDILRENMALCTRMKVVPATEYVYTVHDKQKYFIICLKERTCSCNAFQLDEISCAHACAVLDNKNFQKGPYYCDLYKSKTVLKTYDISIYPLPYKDDWIISVSILGEIVLPPKFKQPSGRPAKKNHG
ncbi:uncharacterized protein LOC107868950 [Capsicum annuum]|uniref:uncharacterized protein LOC107868950 n=1 Tax=Capsicum annuum TaxID=4072 RepID=UPI0007BEBD5C|nr:uncharacterized protein LOC107868950 [Capsicum annuum]